MLFSVAYISGLLSADYQIMAALTLTNNFYLIIDFYLTLTLTRFDIIMHIKNRNSGMMGSWANWEEGTAKELMGRVPSFQHKF